MAKITINNVDATTAQAIASTAYEVCKDATFVNSLTVSGSIISVLPDSIKKWDEQLVEYKETGKYNMIVSSSYYSLVSLSTFFAAYLN